jgi:para-aminobenzoate synthetase component 2
MILVIDHYDSFVYNVSHYLEILGMAVHVVRFDDPQLSHLVRQKARGLVLSPGPCSPAEASSTVDLIRSEAGRLPILGICLGHQCIGEAFDVPVIPAPEPVHGRRSLVWHDGDPLFAGLPNPFPAGRYHSLALPAESNRLGPLRRIAHTVDGVAMAVRHRHLPVVGVQFHPESILTPDGMALIANFLRQNGLLHSQSKLHHV